MYQPYHARVDDDRPPNAPYSVTIQPDGKAVQTYRDYSGKLKSISIHLPDTTAGNPGGKPPHSKPVSEDDRALAQYARGEGACNAPSYRLANIAAHVLSWCVRNLGIDSPPTLSWYRDNGTALGLHYAALNHIALSDSLDEYGVVYATAHETHHAYLSSADPAAYDDDRQRESWANDYALQVAALTGPMQGWTLPKQR